MRERKNVEATVGYETDQTDWPVCLHQEKHGLPLIPPWGLAFGSAREFSYIESSLGLHQVCQHLQAAHLRYFARVGRYAECQALVRPERNLPWFQQNEFVPDLHPRGWIPCKAVKLPSTAGYQDRGSKGRKIKC